MLLKELREEVLQTALKVDKYGLITLTGGNVSGRDKETGYIVVTPSGLEYDTLSPEDMVIVDLEGNIIEGHYKPSVDTASLLYIFKNRDDINGLIHTHSTYASSFAVKHESIPVVSTTLANEIGGEVPVARFTGAALNFGPSVCEVIGDVKACLLANHGVMAVGSSVKHALVAAVMLEDAAKVYYLAKTSGTPIELPAEEIKRAKEVFAFTYGQK